MKKLWALLVLFSLAPASGCGTSSKAVVEEDGCTFDSECAQGEVCRAGACEATIGCEASSACPSSTPTCSPERICVECLADADCGAVGVRCLGNSCSKACSDDTGCEYGSHCDAVTGFCVQCSSDAECPESQHCTDFHCRADSCVPGSARCDAAANVVIACDPSGEREIPYFCPAKQTCAEKDGSASCSPWTCEPGTSWCGGDKLHSCRLDGLSETEPTNCKDMKGACVDAKCVDVICKPGEKKCTDSFGSVLVCNETGTEFLVDEACATGYYCDTKEPACKPQQCVPDEILCNGSVATKCAPDGSAELPGGTNCANDGKACSEGICKAIICTGTYVCSDGNVYACTENGTAKTLWSYCESYYQYCQDGLSYCQYDVCSAGAAYCSNNVFKTCNSDGSGSVDAGTDCGSDAVCSTSGCIPKVCTPNSYFCSGGNVQRCSSDGTYSSTYDSCASYEYCSEGISSCLYDNCTNGTDYCSGDTAMKCAADGSGPVDAGTPCDAKNCYQGQCLDVVCTSGYSCVNGNPNYCTNNQTAFALADTCLLSEYCQDGNYSCLTDVCTAEQPVCVGTKISTCKSDGSGAVDSGADCPDGELCSSNACKPVICTPGAFRCGTAGPSSREVCNASGTEWNTSTSCGDFLVCNPADAICEPSLVCYAYYATCAGESAAVCNSSGTGYSSISTDCHASGQTCTMAGGSCAASALDGTSGNYTSMNFSAGSLVYQTYFVDTPRALTEISMESSYSSSATLTWAVWESTSPNSGFSLLGSTTTTTTSGFMERKSGPINIPLAARKYYLVGVRSTSAGFLSYATLSALEQTSFGGQVGMGTATYSSLPSTIPTINPLSRRVSMKLRTVAP